MLIHFTCQCGNPISMASQFAGKRARCKQCGRVVLVPSPAAVPPEPAPTPPPAFDEDVVLIPVTAGRGGVAGGYGGPTADGDEAVLIPVSGPTVPGWSTGGRGPGGRRGRPLLVAGIVVAGVGAAGLASGAYVYFARPSLPAFAARWFGQSAPVAAPVPSPGKKTTPAPSRFATRQQQPVPVNRPSPVRPPAREPQRSAPVVLLDLSGRWESDDLEYIEFRIQGDRIIGGREKNRAAGQEVRIVGGKILGSDKAVYEREYGAGGAASVERSADGTLMHVSQAGFGTRRSRMWKSGTRAPSEIAAAVPRPVPPPASQAPEKPEPGPPVFTTPAALAQALNSPSPQPVIWVQIDRKDVGDEQLKKLREWVEQGGVLWLDTDLARSFRLPLSPVPEDRVSGRAGCLATGQPVLGDLAPNTMVGYRLAPDHLAVHVSLAMAAQFGTGLLGWTASKQERLGTLQQPAAQARARRPAPRPRVRPADAAADELWLVCAVREQGRGAVVYRPREIDVTTETGRRFEAALRAYRPGRKASVAPEAAPRPGGMVRPLPGPPPGNPGERDDRRGQRDGTRIGGPAR